VLESNIIIDCFFLLLLVVLLNIYMVVRLQGLIEKAFGTRWLVTAMTEVLVVFVAMIRLIALAKEYRPVLELSYFMFRYVAVVAGMKLTIVLIAQSCLIVDAELSGWVRAVMRALAFVRVLNDVGFNFNLSGYLVQNMNPILVKYLVYMLVLPLLLGFILKVD
jgi:hypothetical protein